MNCTHNNRRTCETTRCEYWTDAAGICFNRYHGLSSRNKVYRELSTNDGDCPWDSLPTTICAVHRDFRFRNAAKPQPEPVEQYLSPFTEKWT